MRASEAVRARIKMLCTINNISLNKLATMSGITQSTLDGINNYKSKNPTISTVAKVCDGLNISLREFFNDDIFDDIEQEIK